MSSSQQKQHAKSMRTAFIRVYGDNKTKKGLVSYKADDINKILNTWAKTNKLKYWFSQHEDDIKDEDRRTHFHIVIKFKNPTAFKTIKSKFPYGDIETAKNISNCIQYLIHQNDESKRQYKKENIITNAPDEVEKYLVDKKNIDFYLKEIIDGNIREYNQYEKIPAQLWVKHKRVIENSHLFYKERIYQEKDRLIHNVFIYGDTGTGKTTWVKEWCKKKNYSLCISSSSNDAFQDYKGEDILLLDDLRDTVFKFHDLLKILDNHTKSSSQSRYHNKFFIGKNIIITSTIDLHSWYPFEDPVSRLQLYRRIHSFQIFTKRVIDTFNYNENTHKYEKKASYVNPYHDKFDKYVPENMMQDMNFDYIIDGVVV